MKYVVVISGKGGTGKTTIATSLFACLPDSVLADCDVDAPDTHILLEPEETWSDEFIGTRKAFVDPITCAGGDLCHQLSPCVSQCRFQALTLNDETGTPVVNSSRCEGCGVCVLVCPSKSFHLEDTVVGRIAEAETAFGPMVHARLIPGEETSGKLVSEVRQLARKKAETIGAAYVLADGSPGIGCPVISSLTGADLAVLVTEPSLSALSDLKRLVTLLKQFRIPAVTVINKWDISAEVTSSIESFCADSGLDIVMKLPYEPKINQAITDRSIPSVVLPEFFDKNGFSILLERVSEVPG